MTTSSISVERDQTVAPTLQQKTAALIRMALWCADMEQNRAPEVAEQAVNLAGELDDPVMSQRARYARAVVGVFVNPVSEVAKSYQELLRLGVAFSAAGLSRDAAWCDLICGEALDRMDDPGGAALLVDRALAHFRQLGDIAGQSRSFNSLGLQQALSGRLREALNLFERGRELAIQGQLSAARILISLNCIETWIEIGRQARLDGRIGEATTAFSTVYQQCGLIRERIHQLSNQSLPARFASLLAVAHAHLGNQHYADAEIDYALQCAGSASPAVLRSARCAAGEVSLLFGEYKKARILFQSAWDSPERTFDVETVRVLRGLVAAHEALGELSAAFARHRELLKIELIVRDLATRREREITHARMAVLPIQTALAMDEADRAAQLARENEVLAAEREQLERLAYTDTVTGLPNRRYFDCQLSRMAIRAELAQGALSLIIVDVDRFKQINDVHGHLVGDAVLGRIAYALQHACRRNDVAARVGGEEFALLLPGVQLPAAIVAAERLRQTVCDLTFTDIDPSLQVTISAGVATFRPGVVPEQVYASADAALYEAKGSGRNKVCIAPSADSSIPNEVQE